MSSSQTPEFPRRIASTYDALRRGDDYDAFVARLVSAGDLAGRGYTLRSLLVVARAGA